MDSIANGLQRVAKTIWIELTNLYSVWTLYQVLLVLTCYLVAHALTAVIEPRLETRLRRVENQPHLLRVLAVVLRRLKWLLFAALLWASAAGIREVTWVSRAYFVGLAASLAGTWFVASALSRIIRKRALARLVAIAAWSVTALYIVGLLDSTVAFLDWAAVSLGGMRISLFTLLKGVTVLAVLLWIGQIAGDLIETRTSRSELFSPSSRVLLGKLAKALMLAVAAVASLSAAGIDLTALTIFSGALGLGLGFGLQKVASNLASGFIMLMDRSIKPGDVIQLGDTFGWITSLRARYVSLVTRDGAEYLIPNEQFISERVINWSHTDRNIRLEIRFGVDYASDPHMVRRVVREAVGASERVLKMPPPVCHLSGFGDSSLDFVARFWICDPEGGVTNIKGEVLLAIWDVLKANGIQIPYPHVQVIRTSHKAPADGEPPVGGGSPEREPSTIRWEAK